jgi:hypothetical protein
MSKMPGAEDDHAGVEKHAAGVGGVGVAKQECGHDVDDQADEREHVGGDAGQRQAVHDAIEKPAASAAKALVQVIPKNPYACC